MQLSRVRRRHHTTAYLALSALAFAAAVPAVVGSRQLVPQFDRTALAAARDSITLATRLPLISSAGLILDAGTLSIAATQAPSARTSEGLLTLLSSGKARLTLNGARLTFSSAATAAGLPPPGEATAPIVSTLLHSGFEVLSIRRAAVSLPRADGTSLEISNLNAEVSLKRKGFVAVTGSFDLAGKPLTFETQIGLGDRSTASRLPIQGTLDGQHLRVTLNGRISLGDGLQLSAQRATIASPSVRELAAWLGYAWPTGRGFERLSIEGNLDLVNQWLSVQQATLALDGNEATGILYVLLDRSRPQVDATLALRKLDLTPYLGGDSEAPPPVSAAGPSVGGATGAGRSPAPPPPRQQPAALPSFTNAANVLTLPIIRHLDADVRLSADRIVLAGTAIGRAAATVTARGGRLTGSIADLELDGGGQGGGQIGVDMTGAEPAFSLSAQLRGVELSTFVPHLGSGIPVVEGRGKLTADVTARGGSGTQIAETLSGRAGITYNQGGRLAVDLARIMESAPAAQTTAPRTTPLAPAAPGPATPVLARGAMTLDQLTARFTIAGGLWTTESLWASTGNAIYTATGTFYPPAQVLDLSLARGSVPVQGVPTDDATAPQPAVRVRGAWQAPTVTQAPIVMQAPPR